MLPRPPSTGLPSTWLTRISRWRIAKTAPFSSSSIERPDRFRSSAAIGGRGSRTCPWPGTSGRASATSAGGSATSDTVAPALDRDELDERDRRHRQLELQGQASLCGPDGVLLPDCLEVVGRAETRPARVVGPVGPAESLPRPGDVRVPGVNPAVPELVPAAEQPLDPEGDRPTERPHHGTPGLVESPVPERDRDPAVGVAGGPRL